MVLQGLVGSLMLYMFPSITNWNMLWDVRGLIAALLLHMVVAEPLYYVMHRLFHNQPKLYNSYHSLHHLSPVPQPYTGKFFLLINLFIYVGSHLALCYLKKTVMVGQVVRSNSFIK